MAGPLLALAWCAASFALWVYCAQPRLSPDGIYYLRVACRKTVPSPYSRRTLLPLLLGERVWPWRVATGAAAVACGPLLALYVGGGWQQEVFSAALLSGLFGIFALPAHLPVLVDAPAMALALAAAVAAQHGVFLVAVVAAAVAGLFHERAPVFAAAWSLCPWLLLALPVLGAVWACTPTAPPDAPWLEHPMIEARKTQAAAWHDWKSMLAPWGVLALLAPLEAPRAGGAAIWSCLLSLALGYGQLLMAQDRARLFLWAAPPVIALVARGTPTWLMPLLVVVHLVVSERSI